MIFMTLKESYASIFLVSLISLYLHMNRLISLICYFWCPLQRLHVYAVFIYALHMLVLYFLYYGLLLFLMFQCL